MSLRVRIVTPLGVVLDDECEYFAGEDIHGSFGILPRHTRFQTVLVPSVLSLRKKGGEEVFVAVDRGYLEVEDGKIRAVVRRGAGGESWGEMEERVRRAIEGATDEERRARQVFDKLKVNMQRHLADLSGR